VYWEEYTCYRPYQEWGGSVHAWGPCPSVSSPAPSNGSPLIHSLHSIPQTPTLLSQNARLDAGMKQDGGAFHVVKSLPEGEGGMGLRLMKRA
jgi:hypothetical protein